MRVLIIIYELLYKGQPQCSSMEGIHIFSILLEMVCLQKEKVIDSSNWSMESG